MVARGPAVADATVFSMASTKPFTSLFSAALVRNAWFNGAPFGCTSVPLYSSVRSRPVDVLVDLKLTANGKPEMLPPVPVAPGTPLP